MSVFEHPEYNNHETIVFARDSATGLRAIIAVHSTKLGPATGGCRLWPYASEEAALRDALRLSRGMTFKNAGAGLRLGGGKAVIMLEPGQTKTPELMRAFGRAVERLNGAYITAEDVGVSVDDMAEVRSQTAYVTGLTIGEMASGDPSPVTARGVYESLLTGARATFGHEDIGQLRIAVQGLGHVGWRLCELLHEGGASLIVADINDGHAQSAHRAFGAQIVEASRIHAQDCDVFAPCALGGILTRDSISELRVRLIVGAANNQLAEEHLAVDIHARGIVLLPDFIVNAGGIMNAAAEIEGVRAVNWIDAKLAELQAQLAVILRASKREDRSPFDIAMEMVQAKLRVA